MYRLNRIGTPQLADFAIQTTGSKAMVAGESHGFASQATVINISATLPVATGSYIGTLTGSPTTPTNNTVTLGQAMSVRDFKEADSEILEYTIYADAKVGQTSDTTLTAVANTSTATFAGAMNAQAANINAPLESKVSVNSRGSFDRHQLWASGLVSIRDAFNFSTAKPFVGVSIQTLDAITTFRVFVSLRRWDSSSLYPTYPDLVR